MSRCDASAHVVESKMCFWRFSGLDPSDRRKVMPFSPTLSVRLEEAGRSASDAGVREALQAGSLRSIQVDPRWARSRSLYRPHIDPGMTLDGPQRDHRPTPAHFGSRRMDAECVGAQ